MTATLELTEGTLRRHLSLEVLNCTLDATISNLNLERSALYCFSRISHGGRDMADEPGDRKPGKAFSSMTPTEKTFPGRPSGIRAPHGAKDCTISWPNGEEQRISNRILRGFCPCAGCQGHSGHITFQSGRNEDLRDLRPVGNYALCLVWGDGHDSGIYSFEFLYQLGCLVSQLGEEGLVEMEELPRGRVVPAQTPGA